MDGLEASGSWSHLTGVMLGRWGDDGSVGDNENWHLVLLLKMFLNESTDLFESSKGSVWDSDEEVLGG